MLGGKLEFNTESISEKITSIIPQNNIINLISYWENIVVSSSKKVIENFDNIAKDDSNKKNY